MVCSVLRRVVVETWVDCCAADRAAPTAAELLEYDEYLFAILTVAPSRAQSQAAEGCNRRSLRQRPAQTPNLDSRLEDSQRRATSRARIRFLGRRCGLTFDRQGVNSLTVSWTTESKDQSSSERRGVGDSCCSNPQDQTNVSKDGGDQAKVNSELVEANRWIISSTNSKFTKNTRRYYYDNHNNERGEVCALPILGAFSKIPTN